MVLSWRLIGYLSLFLGPLQSSAWIWIYLLDVISLT